VNTLSQQNEAGDNVAGLKIVINSQRLRINHHKLSRLFDQFEEEFKNDKVFKETLEDLERYTTPKVNAVIGLEDKLERGRRVDLIEIALEAKEEYAKRLVKYQFYESAQRINAFLLALVISYFRNKVKPVILSGADNATVSKLIADEIIDPLLSLLADDVIIGFNAEHIEGMLYYLTGNCHINWD
jgi:hypothetical protein